MSALTTQLPTSSLLETISCSICTEIFRNPKITPCGHTYCHDCIDEWIARNSPTAACPLCNTSIPSKASLIKHHTFDNLLNTIIQQKEQAENKYFNALLESSETNTNTNTTERTTLERKENDETDTSSTSSTNSTLSPIESIFKKHMNRSLGTFQRYQAQINLHFEKLASQTTTPEELKIVQIQHKQSNTNLLEKYDTYLTNAMPEPAMLPCTTNLFMDGRKDPILGIHIEPSTFPSEIIQILYDTYSNQGDPIKIEMETESKTNTDTNKNQKTNQKTNPNLIVHYIPSTTHNGSKSTIQLHNNATIYQQINGPVEVGARLLIVGTFQRTSELPQQCVAKTWNKDQLYDYFKCNDCNKNWICQSCALTCHKDHTIVSFLKAHKPSFACCYCKKTKCCQLRS